MLFIATTLQAYPGCYPENYNSKVPHPKTFSSFFILTKNPSRAIFSLAFRYDRPRKFTKCSWCEASTWRSGWWTPRHRMLAGVLWANVAVVKWYLPLNGSNYKLRLCRSSGPLTQFCSPVQENERHQKFRRKRDNLKAGNNWEGPKKKRKSERKKNCQRKGTKHRKKAGKKRKMQATPPKGSIPTPTPTPPPPPLNQDPFPEHQRSHPLSPFEY